MDSFYVQSFSELNPEQNSQHSAWETPDPGYWTSVGYAVLRVDERGLGQSPGLLDTMPKSNLQSLFRRYRMGLRSTLVVWQGGTPRNLKLCGQPVASGSTPAPRLECNYSLGRHVRLLQGQVSSRRYPVGLIHQVLVGQASRDESIRPTWSRAEKMGRRYNRRRPQRSRTIGKPK